MLNYRHTAKDLQSRLISLVSPDGYGDSKTASAETSDGHAAPWRALCAAAVFIVQRSQNKEPPSMAAATNAIDGMIQTSSEYDAILLRLAKHFLPYKDCAELVKKATSAIRFERLSSLDQQVDLLFLNAETVPLEAGRRSIMALYDTSSPLQNVFARFGELKNIHRDNLNEWLTLLEQDAAANRQTPDYAVRYALALALDKRLDSASAMLHKLIHSTNKSLRRNLIGLLCEELTQHMGFRLERSIAEACFLPVLRQAQNLQRQNPKRANDMILLDRLYVALGQYGEAWEATSSMQPGSQEAGIAFSSLAAQYWVYEQPEWVQKAAERSLCAKKPEPSSCLAIALAQGCAGRSKQAADYLRKYQAKPGGKSWSAQNAQDRRIFWMAMVNGLTGNAGEAQRLFDSWTACFPARHQFAALLKRAIQEGSRNSSTIQPPFQAGNA